MKRISVLIMIAMATIFVIAPSIATAQPSYAANAGPNSDNSINPCIINSANGVSTSPISADIVCGPNGGTSDGSASASPGHVGVRATTTKTVPNSLAGQMGATAIFEDVVIFSPINPGVPSPAQIPVKLNLAFAGTQAIAGDYALADIRACVHVDRNFSCLRRSESSEGSSGVNGFTALSPGLIQTPQALVPVGTPVGVGFFMEATAFARELSSARVDFAHSLDFPTGMDVFELPPGFTVNAPSAFVFDNRFFPDGAPLSDSLPPVTSAFLSSAANAAGWHNHDVTLTLTAVDDGSGVRDIIYSAEGAQSIASTVASGLSVTVDLSAEGTTTVSFYAVDEAGNTEAVQTLTVNIDKTAPVIALFVTPSANAAGWNNSDVTADFRATDLLSGVVEPSQQAVVFTTEGTGLTATRTFSDNAGNTASQTAVVNLDKTAPEAYLRFDPSSQDLLIFGQDSFSGTQAAALAPMQVTPSQWSAADDVLDVDVPLPGERGISTQLRTYAISDRADNILTIDVKVRRSNKQIRARLISLRYQQQPVVRAASNLSWFVWTTAGSGSFHLEQSMFVDGDGIGAHFFHQTNETKIAQLRRGPRVIATRPGIALLRMVTNRGSLGIEY